MQDSTSASAAVEPDYNHHHHQYAQLKRNNRTKRPVFKVLQGQIAFRLVCHASTVGGLIGSSGSIVSQLRRDTGCKIHCEDSVSGTDDRVILVIGPVLPRKGVALSDGDVDLVDVSSAQEAVLRVFERICELEMEKGFNNPNRVVNGEVTCKLLAHTSQIGAVVGKGGKNISTIRNNSGAKIRVCPSPQCAAKDEELLLITGGILAVKKALISVSYCLQDCPPLNKVSQPVATSTVSSSDTLSLDPNADLFPHLNSWLLSMEGLSIYDSYDASKRTTKSNGASSHETKVTEREIVFRLLCSNNVAGSVIGKKGAIVRNLESKTGASIIFAAPLSEFAERIVTISAIENLESCYSPSQDAVFLVFARIIEDHIEKGFLSISIPSATDNDVVLQITGAYRCVQNALYKVTCIIRDNFSPNEVPAESRMKSSWKPNKDPPRGNHFGHGRSFPSGRFLQKNVAVHAETISKTGEVHSDLSGRANLLATVTNTTVEIVVSEHVFGSVYGEDGGNLDRIKQISGADVQVYDPCAGKSGGRVVISGTPDQTFAAQSLLQAFIQTGQRGPE
ncbi:hypothetical protein AAHE18_05G004100 [Arachis hypogaea]